MTDFSRMLLGRRDPLPADETQRVMMAAVIPTATLPTPPDAKDWNEGAMRRPVFGNDEVGDCTCATIANALVGAVKVAYGKNFLPTTSDVFALYSAVTDFDPNARDLLGNNPTDNGAVFEDVLTYVLRHGFKDHHMIGSFGVDPSDATNIKRTIDMFGSADFGIRLPKAWQSMKTWTMAGYTPGDPNWKIGSWGGHEVNAEAYDASGVYVWTWGELVHFTWDAVAHYADEVDGVVWASWIKAGKSPEGLDLSALETYANEIKAA